MKAACGHAPVGIVRSELPHIQPPKELIVAVERQEAAQGMHMSEAESLFAHYSNLKQRSAIILSNQALYTCMHSLTNLQASTA